jgi:hypothetical protein
MTIFLLKSSQYNEEFVLSGYATNDDEIKQIAIGHVREFSCVSNNTKLEAIFVAPKNERSRREVSVYEGNEHIQTFYIVPIEQVHASILHKDSHYEH